MNLFKALCEKYYIDGSLTAQIVSIPAKS